MAVRPVLIDNDQFACIDVADIIRTDDVEGAAFRSEDVGVAQLTQYQRTNAKRVADTDQRVLCQRDD